MVDDMLVFGWPIRAKVASFGWNSRRSLGFKQFGVHGGKGLPKVGDREGWDSGNGGNRSFVEIVKGNQTCCVKETIEQALEMEWNSKDNKNEWLSKLLGEPLLIDEETMQKERFDRGRILVLIPHNQSSTSLIKVLVGSESFFIKISEDSFPADHTWPTKYLGLKRWSSQAALKALPVKEIDVLDVPSFGVNQEKKVMGGREVRGQQMEHELDVPSFVVDQGEKVIGEREVKGQQMAHKLDTPSFGMDKGKKIMGGREVRGGMDSWREGVPDKYIPSHLHFHFPSLHFTSTFFMFNLSLYISNIRIYSGVRSSSFSCSFYRSVLVLSRSLAK
ncbi:hypothetical protein Q3G72_025034 [Acer saccharum]|nr:hypothetical protein Q3G72_025034 [Acer saccharum]